MSSNYSIVDRRLNPSGKNLSNRQRFLRKAKEALARSVKDGLLERSISSHDDQNVTVPSDGTHEPHFRHDHTTGKNDYILPGNKEFVVGDLIEKPKSGSGGGGTEGSDQGGGEDAFTFPLSKDEFNSILFDGLELPNLKKKSIADSTSFVSQRSGHTSEGTPCNLDLIKSMKNSIGRRVSLKTPKIKKLAVLIEKLDLLLEIEEPSVEQTTTIEQLKVDIARLQKKIDAITFLDPLDLRYRNFEKKPKPRHKAVMFCIMDVSGSMGEHEKELAKRFYLLLYLFLEYKYDTVDVVFIRHHDRAQECTEEEFFYSRESGGTIVSTGFAEMLRIQRERYDISEWNCYLAQTSDGDNFAFDNEPLAKLLLTEVLPIVQFFAYVEVHHINYDRDAAYQGRQSDSGLWPIYRKIRELATEQLFKMERVNKPEEIYTTFRDFFAQVITSED